MKTTTESAMRSDEAPVCRRLSRAAAARLGVALAAAGLLFGVSCMKTESTLSAADRDFVLAAAQGGMTEVKLGELAAQKGTRDDVKAFGQMMVRDHTAINGDLKALAAQKAVTLPGSLDAEHQAMVDKLAALTGAAFDEAYVAGMIKDHQMDAKDFTAISARTRDAEVKSFVDKSIPVVTEHLKRITAMKI